MTTPKKKPARRQFQVKYMDKNDLQIGIASFYYHESAVRTLTENLVERYPKATYALLSDLVRRTVRKFEKVGRTKVRQVVNEEFPKPGTAAAALKRFELPELTPDELQASILRFPFGVNFPVGVSPRSAQERLENDFALPEQPTGRGKMTVMLPGPEVTFSSIEMAGRHLVMVDGQPTGVIVVFVPNSAPPPRDPHVQIEERFAYLPFATDATGTPVVGDETTVLRHTQHVAPLLKNFLKNLRGI